MKSCLLITFCMIGAALACSAHPGGTSVESDASTTAHNSVPPASASNTGYVLGPGDGISLTVAYLDDSFADKVFRIGTDGNVDLPWAGRFHAAGLTTEALAAEVKQSLENVLKDPDVTITIAEFASEPVSILGEVNKAGVHQIQGQKSLLEVLALGEGFTQRVGNTVTVTRDRKWGRIPLPNAHVDPTGRYTVASVDLKRLLSGKDPTENIPVKPHDVITVSRAEIVYAVGSVNKPGGFPLGQQDKLSTLQALSLAEGLKKTAAPRRAMILREVPGSTTRTEIAVNIKALMNGNRRDDVPLQPGDILFVPSSKAKSISYRALDAIVRTASGVAVYGRY